MLKERYANIEDILLRFFHYIAVTAVIIAAAVAVILRNFKFLIPFYVILGNISLGAFVFLKGRGQRINTSFSFITLFVAVWTFSIFMYTQANTAHGAILWSRIAASSSSFIPALFLYFTLVFPKEEKEIRLSRTLLLGAVAVLFCILSFTDFIVKGAVRTPFGFWFSPGRGLVIFLLYFIGFMGFVFYELLKKHHMYTGISRMQIRYVILGFFLGTSFPVITNIILPLFGIVEFSGYGPFSTIIALAFIAYAIIRHRLMSIEFVIQRGLIYAVITAFIMSMYALAILVSERLLRGAAGYSTFAVVGVAAIIIAILYQPFLRILKDITDRLFFHRHYDYQKTLKEASHAIASIIRLPQLTKLIVSTFIETMAVSEISFLLFDKAKKRFKSADVEIKGASRYKRMEIDEGNPLIEYLRTNKEILIREELENKLLRSKSSRERESIERVIEEMERVGVPIWVPIIFKDELLAVIASGNKLSGEVFTAEDLGLLSILANQAAVALDNARLYEEILSMKTYSDEILKSMTNGVLTTDLKGKVITFNSMAEKISGYTAAEVIGRNVMEIWKEGILCTAAKGTAEGRFYFNYEANLIKKNESIVPVSVSTTLLKNSKGENIGVLAVFSDLSEVKELEGKVRQADKLAALGTMAAGMAHEIKNPLSSMKVLSQLMPLKFGDGSFRKRFIDIMPREISRIDRIVESLLGFARATVPKLETIDLKKIIDEVLSFFEEDMKQRKIKLDKNFDKVPGITGDAGQIGQVFSNLILNAVQAMPKGGVLKVDLKEGEKKEGVLEGVQVEISDTGHGISEEYTKKLFDPFFTTKHGGTGLGLTISHSIIDGHKGTISVKSEAGKGTTFKITLPLTQQ